MGFLLTLLVIGYSLICVFLVALILLQAGKGGGLSGLVGGSALADTFGATGAEKTFARWTTYLAVLFFVLSLGLTFIGARHFKKASLFDRLQQEEATAATQPIPQAQATAPQPVSAPADQSVPVRPAAPEVSGEVTAPESPEDVQAPETGEAPVTPEEQEQPAESAPVVPEQDTSQP